MGARAPSYSKEPFTLIVTTPMRFALSQLNGLFCSVLVLSHDGDFFFFFGNSKKKQTMLRACSSYQIIFKCEIILYQKKTSEIILDIFVRVLFWTFYPKFMTT